MSAAFRWSVAAVFLAAIVAVGAVFLRQSAFPWLKKWTVGNPTPKTVTESVRSIAVLPFETLGQDMNNELLRLGMADAIIGRISNLKPLVVLPTIAVSKYKGRADDPLTAGRTFGVDAVLTGTVQRSGDQKRFVLWNSRHRDNARGPRSPAKPLDLTISGRSVLHVHKEKI